LIKELENVRSRLYQHENAKIRAWAKAQYLELQGSIRKEHEWEEQRNRKVDERFE
jgi:hypothetical protein